MKIEVLGTRSKIEPSAQKYKNYSGFLIDDKILLDAGEASYLERSPETIIFTHFHPDHAFFVFKDQEFIPKIPLFGPEKHSLVPNLNVISGKFDVIGYKITPIPVIHALHLKSLGYLIEKDAKKVFFSGDVA